MIATPLSHAKRKFKRLERFVFASDVSPDLRTKLDDFDVDFADVIGLYLNQLEAGLMSMICFTNLGIIVHDADKHFQISYSEMLDIAMSPGSESEAGYLLINGVDGSMSTLIIEGRDDSRGTDDTYDVYMFLQAVAGCPA